MPRVKRPSSGTAAVEGQVKIRSHAGTKNLYARYVDADGVRREVALGTQLLAEARVKAREIDAYLKAGVKKETRPQSITFAEFADRFVESYSGWSEATKLRNGPYFVANFCDQWGKRQLNSITTGEIQQWVSSLLVRGNKRSQGRPLSPNSVNLHRCFLSSMFRTAVEWGMIESNPVAPVKRIRVQEQPPDPLTLDELDRLLEHLPDYAAWAVRVMAYTGMRRGEAFGLVWRDVDLVNGITVRNTKTAKFRVIPIIDELKEELRRRQGNASDPVVPGPDGKPLADLRVSLAQASEKAGIPRVHHHRLRHTFATILRDSGAPLDRIQALLGHSTMAMTLRYARSNPTQLQGAMDAFSGSLRRHREGR